MCGVCISVWCMCECVGNLCGVYVRVCMYVVHVLCDLHMYQRLQWHSQCRDGTGYSVFPRHWYSNEIPKRAENHPNKAM